MPATAALLIAAAIHPVPGSGPIPVKVEAGGDDGYTQRLEAALEAAFAACDRFRPYRAAEGGKPLTVTIPTNLLWQSVGARDRILYRIKFSGAKGLRVRTSSGSCREDRMTVCADQVVRDALRAVAR
jgi:hypothetical protein